MLRIRTLVVFFLLAIAVTPVLVATTARAQTAEDIIKKHIDAIGGQEAWNKVTAMRVTGTVNVQGTEINVKLSQALNRGMRVEGDVMGMSGYTCWNTKDGWSFWPMNGQQQPEPMTADDLKESQEKLTSIGDPLIRYKDNGIKVESMGKEDLDGTECFKLKLTFKSGTTETLFIDPATFYCLRSTEKSMANGQVQEQSHDFSDYKKLPEGITVPMMVGSPMGPIKVSKVEINPELKDAAFTKS